MSIAYHAVSTEQLKDALSLKLDYKNAEVLHGDTIPSSLNFDDFASVELTFSNRVDSPGNRDKQVAPASSVTGIVTFEVTNIERIK